MRKKFWKVIEASVWFSLRTGMPSFASTAWCRPSDQRRPGIRRPVNSSTITTSGLPVLALAHHVVDVALLERVRR